MPDTRRIFYGSPLASKEQRAKRMQGFISGYLEGFTELPLQVATFLAPDAGYTPGELRSSPKDRLRAEQFDIQNYMEEMGQNPDFASGAQLGYGASLVVDPVMDTGFAVAPYAARALKGFDAMQGLSKAGRLLKSQGGAIGDVNKVRELKANLLREINKAKKEGHENIGVRVFHEDENPTKGDYLPSSFNWDDNIIDLESEIGGTAAFRSDLVDEALAYSLGGGEKLGVIVGPNTVEHFMPEYGAMAIEDAILYSELFSRPEELRLIWDSRKIPEKLKKPSAKESISRLGDDDMNYWQGALDNMLKK